MEKMKLKLLYSDLRPELEMIEKELEQAVDSESLLLNDASLIYCRPEGKESDLFLFCLQENLAITI